MRRCAFLNNKMWRVPPRQANAPSAGKSKTGFAFTKTIDRLAEMEKNSRDKNDFKVTKVDDFRIRAGANDIGRTADLSRFSKQYDKPVHAPLPQPKR